ncbi:hypothetical protein ACT7DA_06045 [Bacillus pacificus]
MQTYFLLYCKRFEADLLETEIIQIKELLIGYKVEKCVINAIDNEIIRIGIVMENLQEEM